MEKQLEDERLERERSFHNHAFAEQTRAPTDKFYSVTGKAWDRFRGVLTEGAPPGARVLEYGCGEGTHSFMLAKGGARVTGIDISDGAVASARDKAESEGTDGLSFAVMNAESLAFAADSFDLICGTAILHHLDLRRAFAEIARTLTPKGEAVFIEPMGHNPAINLYRKLTPKFRTPDEHPLLVADLKLAGDYFHRVDASFFHLSSLAAVPFRKLPGFRTLLSALDGFDRLLFRALPFSRRLAWFCILRFSEAKSPHPGQ